MLQTYPWHIPFFDSNSELLLIVGPSVQRYTVHLHVLHFISCRYRSTSQTIPDVEDTATCNHYPGMLAPVCLVDTLRDIRGRCVGQRRIFPHFLLTARAPRRHFESEFTQYHESCERCGALLGYRVLPDVPYSARLLSTFSARDGRCSTGISVVRTRSTYQPPHSS